MSNYAVRIAGDNLIFSAAHFIVLPGGVCEPLHGHNYRVAVELCGPLDEIDCVIDFAALLEIMKSILARLDHAVLLPTLSPRIRVVAGEAEIEVRDPQGDHDHELGSHVLMGRVPDMVPAPARRWVFPRTECRLLPLTSTTVELMANHLAECLLESLSARGLPRPSHVWIELEESPGCTAVCRIECSKP